MSIKAFKHKGLKKFHKDGSTRGIKVSHKKKLVILLTALEAALHIDDMKIPSFRYHKLTGSKKNEPVEHSVWVNGNWRVTFEFENGDAYLLDYRDYH